MPAIEFDKYRRRGDYHWKEFARDSIYRRHALRVRSWITEKTGLDVGCGDGLITHLLGSGWSGIDIDEIAVSYAVGHDVSAKVGDIYDLTGDYEAVYLGDVLEHLESPNVALDAIADVTNTLYIATPPFLGKLRRYHFREWTASELMEFLTGLGWKPTDLIVTENDRMYGKFVR